MAIAHEVPGFFGSAQRHDRLETLALTDIASLTEPSIPRFLRSELDKY